MTYQETLDWIHSKVKIGKKPGLKRMHWLLQRLGNPQKKIKGVHVVGTNGKGSTVANLQHIFTGAGYRVGAFVSPYIMDFRERITIDGQMISREDLVDLAKRVRPIVEALPAETGLEPAIEFEVITIMMFLYFAEINPVDLVIVEAGLGGRLDSTNVFDPLLVICPSIGLDHQAILGETHVEIAAEKAGVIKTGRPFLFASHREDVRQYFREYCLQQKAPLYELGMDFRLSDSVYQDKAGHQLHDMVPNLPGKHQIDNAALAIQASLLLKTAYPLVTETAIRRGLRSSRWMGRTELLRPNLMLDGAHNNESIAALVDLLQASYKAKQVHVLFAAIEGKPVEGMLEQLGQIGQVSVTTFSYPRPSVWKATLLNTQRSLITEIGCKR